jgi:RNA polymerase sigma-70 factor (ECF subfamily)
MKNSEEIKVLVSRCLGGNRESFGTIVRRFQQQIYDLCFHYLGTMQDAEDATADVFIKAYRSLTSFNPQYAFSTWLYKIAVNHSIGILRRQKREREYLKDEGANPLTVKSARPPEAVFFENDQKAAFFNALVSLPDKYRTALMLKYQQDLSYKEIGEIMDMPVNTVGSLILRGKKELRDILEDEIREPQKEASHELL